IYDSEAPILDSVLISSSNINGDTLAISGDQIFIDIYASEALQTPTVTILGQAALVNDAGDTDESTWQAVRTIAGTEPEGIANFTIDFSDTTGNAGVQVTTTSDGSYVRYDHTAPTLTNVSIASNNTYPDKAMTGDVITVTFTGSEDLTSVGVSVFGGGAVVDDLSDGNETTWSASYTVNGTESEGPANFSISFDDASANPGFAVTAVTDLSEVIFDGTPPATTITNLAGDTTNTSPIPVQVTFNEAIINFTVADLTIGNGTAGNFVAVDSSTFTFDVTPAADGLVTVDVLADVATDSSGNGNTAASQVAIYYDGNVPGVVLSTASDLTNQSPFTITATFSEKVDGFELGDWTVVNGTASNLATADSITYTADITPDIDTIVSISIAANTATDVTGQFNTASNVLSVTYDGTAPAGYAISGEAITHSPNELAFDIDGGESGSFYSYNISSDGGGVPIVASNQLYSADPTVLSGLALNDLNDGLLTINVFMTDSAGNTGDTVSTQIQLTSASDITIATLVQSPEDIFQTQTDVVVYAFGVNVQTSQAIEQGFSLSFGDSTLADLFVDNSFKLYRNINVEDFATASIEASGGDFGDGGTPDAIGFIRQDTITPGDTWYYYVAADIEPGATAGTLFNVLTPTLNDFGFADPKNKIDGGLAAGPMLTIQSIDGIAPLVTIDSINTSETRPGLSGSIDDITASLSIIIDTDTTSAIVETNNTWRIGSDTIAALAVGTHDV
ncbi:MAG: hypothetical protein JXQ90_24035, partial [Cyclobacteriaceae bacterium]